jgi:hypothetical protein
LVFFCHSLSPLALFSLFVRLVRRMMMKMKRMIRDAAKKREGKKQNMGGRDGPKIGPARAFSFSHSNASTHTSRFVGALAWRQFSLG